MGDNIKEWLFNVTCIGFGIVLGSLLELIVRLLVIFALAGPTIVKS